MSWTNKIAYNSSFTSSHIIFRVLLAQIRILKTNVVIVFVWAYDYDGSLQLNFNLKRESFQCISCDKIRNRRAFFPTNWHTLISLLATAVILQEIIYILQSDMSVFQIIFSLLLRQELSYNVMCFFAIRNLDTLERNTWLASRGWVTSGLLAHGRCQ